MSDKKEDLWGPMEWAEFFKKNKMIDTGGFSQSLPKFEWMSSMDSTPMIHKEPPLLKFNWNLDPKLQAQIEEKTEKVLEAIEKQMLKDGTSGSPVGFITINPGGGVGNSTTLPKSEWRSLEEGFAEGLQDLANDLYICRDRMRPRSEGEFSLCKLAIGFDRLPPAIRFRAIMEDWPRARIVEEVY